MSFFFNPVPSQFQNYCVLVPVLPYFMSFQQLNATNLNSQFCCSPTKSQENIENSFQNMENRFNSLKYSNLQQEFSLQKNQEKICQQKIKQAAALQSQSTQNNQRAVCLKSKQNSSNQAFGKPNGKTHDKISKTIKIKKAKDVKEEEYQPFEKKKRFQTSLKQNQNRNIIPNQVNQIFSYIQKSSKSKFVVSRIFKKYPPSNVDFTMKKFYLYQSLLKDKISNYINESSLSLVTELYEPRCQVYSEQQQRYYNKVSRILIHHFLQQDSIFNILTSKRMHKDKKRNHLQMRRVLKQKVINIIKH